MCDLYLCKLINVNHINCNMAIDSTVSQLKRCSSLLPFLGSILPFVKFIATCYISHPWWQGREIFLQQWSEYYAISQRYCRHLARALSSSGTYSRGAGKPRVICSFLCFPFGEKCEQQSSPVTTIVRLCVKLWYHLPILPSTQPPVRRWLIQNK